jgi:hexosaminidase
MQDIKNLIFFPTEIEFYDSNNGEDFNLVDNIKRTEISGKNLDTKDFSKTFPNLVTRYLKIIVKNIKVCPVGHPSAGKKAWLFVDEISIH